MNSIPIGYGAPKRSESIEAHLMISIGGQMIEVVPIEIYNKALRQIKFLEDTIEQKRLAITQLQKDCKDRIDDINNPIQGVAVQK